MARSIGTGVATVNGPVGLDRHDLGRAGSTDGAGLGAALTDAVADIATAEGAATLLLVATDRRPAALRAIRVRGPDLVSDVRGARARRGGR